MDSQFNLINNCLQVLRHCRIPSMQKLRLEVQLFQIKLLLLSDEVSAETKGRYCGEAVLQELHYQMVGLRDGEVSGGAIQDVSRRLQLIATGLAGTKPLPAAVETEWN